jgi:ketol-acid reductoisomerase
LNIVVGVRKDGTSWKQAQEDGWVPGKNLFEIDEAIKRGTIVMNLLSVTLLYTELTPGCCTKRDMAKNQAPAN